MPLYGEGVPLLTNKIRYLPSAKSRLPDASLVAYALACLEAALILSDRARSLYLRVIEAFSSPQCLTAWENVKRNIMDNRPACKSVIDRTLAPWYGKKRSKQEDKRLIADIHGIMGNVNNMRSMDEAISRFILGAFNRERDQKDKRWKVVPESAPALVWVVLLRAFVNFLGLDVDSADRQRLGGLADSWFFEATSKPKTVLGRTQRADLHHYLRREKFIRVSDTALIRWGKIWYKCRVDPGQLVEVQQELLKEREKSKLDNLDPSEYDLIASEKDTSYLSKKIEPFDIAMGYPR